MFPYLQVCQCENYKDYSKACGGSCFFVASTQAVWGFLSRGPDTCTSAALPWEASQKTTLLSLTRWFCSFWWARGPICLPHHSTQLPNAESICLCFWIPSNRLKQTSIPVLLHVILRTEILSLDLLGWHEQVLLKEPDSRTRPPLLNAWNTILSLELDRSPKDKALGSAGQKAWVWVAK